MAEHETAARDKQEDVKQKRGTRHQESQPSFDKALTWDIGPFSQMETPFHPRMDEHAAILSRIPFSAQRHEFIMRLNNTYGLRYVQRLVASVNAQAKLTISNPGDIYEQEADRIAEEVTRSINTPVRRQTPEEEEELLQDKLVQRQVPDEEEDLIQGMFDVQRQAPEEDEELIQGTFEVQRQDEEEELQMQPDESKATTVAGDIETRINSKRGSGQPLSDEVRQPMEQAFGADFSGVRTHTDSEADTLNRELSAKAFTTGQDVFFRKGEYSPGSDAGKKLLAHELTHVVQQGQNRKPMRQADMSKTLSRQLVISDDKAVESGQVHKSEFLISLQKSVNDVAAEVLARIGQTPKDCPYIQRWFAYYNDKEEGHIEKAISRYAPETEGARDWQETVSLLADRVRRGFVENVSNGSLEGIPEELPKDLHEQGKSQQQQQPALSADEMIQECTKKEPAAVPPVPAPPAPPPVPAPPPILLAPTPFRMANFEFASVHNGIIGSLYFAEGTTHQRIRLVHGLGPAVKDPRPHGRWYFTDTDDRRQQITQHTADNMITNNEATAQPTSDYYILEFNQDWLRRHATRGKVRLPAALGITQGDLDVLYNEISNGCDNASLTQAILDHNLSAVLHQS